MADQSRLISGGTNYYLEGGGSYTGSGTPWTSSTGSPYALAMNETVGQMWTPQAAQRQEVYGGGPPFRNGQTPIYDSYGNVAETLVIQCRANSHDNAVFLLQQLRKILNTALFSTPCILAVQPNGASNAVYYDIYGADVQEDARFVNQEAGAAASGHALIRAVVTWRRSPHGALITSGETVLSTLTFTNTGTGANNNTRAFSAASGDLIYEGQPLNLSFKPANVAATSVLRTFMGSVLNRTYSTTGAAGLSTTNAITNPATDALANWTITDKLTNAGIKPRVMLRFSVAPSLNIVFRLSVSLFNNTAYAYKTPWVSPVTSLVGYKLLDMGTFPVDAVRRNGVVTTPVAALTLEYASTNGASATATLGYSEYIWYYDWCRIDTPAGFVTDGTRQMNIDQFPEVSNVPATPWPTPQAMVSSSASQMDAFGSVRGRLPRYFSDASFYLGWVITGGDHNTAHTATVSARVSPQWASLRGND